jgi:putative transposase
MDTTFCIEALHEALLLGIPDVLNSDQGSQFTSDAFTTEVKKNGHTKISMTGI